jgi:lipoprotein-anchoring transpeptidase ErfK/SrfK
VRPTFDSSAVRRFVQRIDEVVSRPPRDARVKPSARRLRRLPARRGRTVRRFALERAIAGRLTSASADRGVVVPVKTTQPRVTSRELASRYPRFILIDRTRFRLRFYKRLRLVRTHVIAVGRVGFDTPAGLYRVQNKAIDPVWNVPDKPWAGPLAGRRIPPGPENPIKARWLGIYDGAGIHGTDETWSLGSRASHGCIRMAIPQVKRLYSQVPVGTPVYVG